MEFKKKNILDLMLDIKPVDEKGNLNLEKIGFKNVKKITPKIHPVEPFFEIRNTDPIITSKLYFRDNPQGIDRRARPPLAEITPKRILPSSPTNKPVDLFEEATSNSDYLEYPDAYNSYSRANLSLFKEPLLKESSPEIFIKNQPNRIGELWACWFAGFKNIFFQCPWKKLAFSSAGIFLAIILTAVGVNFFQKALAAKDSATQKGQRAFTNLVEAKSSLESRDFTAAALNFEQAYTEFSLISKEIDSLGGSLAGITRFIPYLSKASSGAYLTRAGEDLSRAGVIFSDLAKDLEQQKDGLNQPEISFLEILKNVQSKSQEISVLLERAKENIDKVNIADLPENYQGQFLELKDKLPEALSLIQSLRSNEEIFTEILGGNGPRKYLFLFQNNQEMRATGGFIGSYGVLNIFNGRVKNFFIDGIFNPDGQLKEKVIPPAPIQKISATWSLHDSNWFPDFPVSAEKAIWFYEKTGGPTVDGVVTMTPTVMQKLLAITGPIEMPDYQITIDQDNFMEKVQQEVEIDYDKELNQPKKILADLTPLILDRLFNSQNFSQMGKIFQVMEASVKERQILIYARNYEVEKKISEMGLSGEVLKTDKDYLSIINSNINGYKTDGVIEQSVKHESEIKADGSIQNTITITRKHNGGNNAYEWRNKVNADYMRVYVPQGSVLLSVEGQTREFNTPPLDYKLLDFKQDSQVRQEEESMEIDQDSGTRVYNDAGKTVFANWVYVSPQEEVAIKYTYVLPFKINLEEKNNFLGAHSLLFQKQAGSLEENFSSQIVYPNNWKVSWKYPSDLEDKGNTIIQPIKKIKMDQFIGSAFVRK